MKRPFLAAALFAVSAALPSALAAQDGNPWQFGVYLRDTWLDPDYNTGAGWGLGARAGYYFAKAWSGQLDFSYSSNKVNDGSTLHTLPVHLRLMYDIPVDKDWAFFLGAGYTYENVSGAASGSSSGIGAVLGLRIHLLNELSAFLDYAWDRTNKPVVNADNSGLEFGASWTPGRAKPAPAPAPAPAAVAVPVAAAAAAPADDDHDGVPNDADRCPNTPPGEPVDAIGCSASQRDSDHDGVVDSKDKCPNTPPGQAVDADGCSASQRDSDGDGVTDDMDKCPDTPKGTPVRADGCPIPPLVLTGVNFETDKAVLLPGSSTELDKVAASLQEHPTVRVEIDGYTDNSGNAAHNVQLSQARADAVKAYLVSKGIAADRMETKGKGSADPVAPNTTAANKAQNRRVVMTVISQ